MVKKSISRCFLFVFLFFMSGVWAQTTINVASVTSGGGVTVSGNDITIGTGATGSIVTGTAAGKRLIISPNVSVTFRNLTITGDMYNAVSISEGAPVTINLQGTNTLSGGIGSAALRVPASANLIVNGPGSLNAFGGQWRSLIGADAGAGIGGGNIANTGGTNAGNLTDNCGTVTINGGTIAAYGGGSGESGSSNNGSRYSYAAGIGGSGMAARGCNLTINGGNVTAVGGRNGQNDIGPGVWYTAANFGGTQTWGTNGTTTINGGSVNAAIRGTVQNGASVSVSSQTFNVGVDNKNEVSDRQVRDCKFGNIVCALTASAASRIYGINDVKTDFDGKVYFWLPSYTAATSDSISLNIDGSFKTYKRTGNTSTNFQGPLPSIAIPQAAQNSKVDLATVYGPYKTGFTMKGSQHVAAVNNPIILYKGAYVRNDASVEASGASSRNHIVTWYRSANTSGSAWNSGVKQQVAVNNTLNSGKDTVIFVPTSSEYDRYVWAEICVRDNGSRPSSGCAADGVVVYPPVLVGVKVIGQVTNGSDAESKASSGIPDASVEGINMNIMRAGSSLAENLAVNYNPTGQNIADANWPLSLSSVTSVRDPQSDVVISVKHRLKWCINGVCRTDSIVAFDGQANDIFGYNNSQSFNFTLPSSGVSSDIILIDELKDATYPHLMEIKICKKDGTDCRIDKVENDNSVSWDNESMEYIPKNGTLTLTFDRPVANIGTAPLEAEKGKVRMVLNGTDSLVFSNPDYNNQRVVEYTYDEIDNSNTKQNLVPGRTYRLVVKDFYNLAKNPMPLIQTDIVVEQKASVSLATGDDYRDGYNAKYSGDTNLFIIGDEIVGYFRYQRNSSGPATAINYYWDIREGNGNNPPSDDIPFPASTSSISSIDQFGIMNTTIKTLASSDFGKWVRLVVRPTGTYDVDGDKLGYAFNFPWKRIGVLLKPAVAEMQECDGETTNTPKFENLTIDFCDVNDPSTYSNHCSRFGAVVYDKDKDVRVSAIPRDLECNGEFTYNKIGSWGKTPDIGTFNVGRLVNYKVNTANPSSGKITIKPNVEEINPPTIESVTLKNIDNEDVDLKQDKEYDIKILGNTLIIEFEDQVQTSTGTITLVGNGHTISLGSRGIWDNNNEVTISLNANDFEGDALGSAFGKEFRIIVSGFKDLNGDAVEAEQFNFVLANAPEFENVEIERVGLPSASSGYAVNNEVKVKTDELNTNYKQNGGNTHNTTQIAEYCWQRSDRDDCLGINSSYIPNANDFSKKIRVAVTPRDVNGRIGTPYYTEWERVGVLMVAEEANNTNATSGATLTTEIGSFSGTESLEGVIITNFPTSLRISSDRNDIFYDNGWIVTPSEAGTPAPKASTVFTPDIAALGENDKSITIKGGMKEATTNITSIKVSKHNLNVNSTYGETLTNFKVEIENNGTTDVTLNASLSSNSSFSIANNEFVISSSSSMEIEIYINNNLPPGQYTDVLTLTDNNNISEEIFLTFELKRKTLTISNEYDNSTTISKVYDKTLAVTTPISWTWDGSSQIESGDNVTIVLRSGNFSDVNVGPNKFIDAYYEIVDNDAGGEYDDRAKYYTFSPSGIEQSEKHIVLTGEITPRPLDITFNSANIGSVDYTGLNYFEGAFSSAYNISTDTPVISGDNVSIDKNNSIFTFKNPNVDNDKEVTPSIALTGSAAINYKIGNITPNPLKADITPISLAHLNTNITGVTATATYGDLLSGFRSWEHPPDAWTNINTETATPVMGANEVEAGGTWRLVSTNGRVGLNNTLYASFDASGNNYIKDLTVPVTLEVKPKPITIEADLTNAGDLGFGAKTYDGLTTITGVKASSKASGLISGDENLLSQATVESATFLDADKENNKNLTITWNTPTPNSELAKKYKLEPTHTIGTIAPRTTYLEGIMVKDKKYDGNKSSSFQPGDIPDYTTWLSNLIPEHEKYSDDNGIGLVMYINIAEFQFANVSWNGNEEEPVPVIFDSKYLLFADASRMTCAESQGDVGPSVIVDECPMSDETYKTLEKNYILKIADAKAKILQRELDEFNPALALKSKADYGTPLIDAPISTAQATDEIIRFPRRLAGLNSEEVPGIWSWNEPGYVGNATTNGTRTCSEGNYTTKKKVLFESQNENYKNYETTVDLCVLPRELMVTAKAPSKAYDKTPDFTLEYDINGVVAPDKVELLIEGKTLDPNVGTDKEFNLTGVSWTNNVSSVTKQNYIKPEIADILPHGLKATINKAIWAGVPPEIKATPSIIIYGDAKYPNLGAVTLSEDDNGKWKWVDAETRLTNPHDPIENPTGFDPIIKQYPVEFTLPENVAVNYYVPQGFATLYIHKRSTDASVKRVSMHSDYCGSNIGRLTVEANDSAASIWYEGETGADSDLPIGHTNKWTFSVDLKKYGPYTIHYEIEAQASGYENDLKRNYGAYEHIRFIPFANATRWVRGKSLAVYLDSTFLHDLISEYNFDLAKTNWYSGETIVGTGYLLDVLPNSGDYNVELFTTTGEIFYSCKESGANPDYVPVMPSQPRINLAASPYGAKVVAGGTTLTLNTPHGGKISIYTLRGELISTTHAIENRTVVKVPSTKGMYIVKLEAK